MFTLALALFGLSRVYNYVNVGKFSSNVPSLINPFLYYRQVGICAFSTMPNLNLGFSL